MPVPFLLAGLGIAAGVIGAGGHLSAKETNECAEKISRDAKNLYDSAKESLERAKSETEKALLKLGYSKKRVLDCSMTQFLNSYDKIKHIVVTESVGVNEISNFVIDQQGAIELREMTNIYSTSLKSGATGAAAGAVIALAASGSLSVVTGGLATAGSALLAGEVGAAAGIAGSALSFGAAMTPLAAIAAPVVLFTGISASMKADENLEKANVMYAEAEEASEKMKVSEVMCNAISERSEMFNDVLVELDEMFSECSSLLAGVVRKKEGRVFKKKLTSKDFTEEDMKLIAVTRALAGAVKAVIDTPILSKEGNLSDESEDVFEKTTGKLPDFTQAVGDIRQIDYAVKPIEIKEKKDVATGTSASRTTVLHGARNVLAFVLGFTFATLFTGSIAENLTPGISKFLFLDSYVTNIIGFWLIICATIIMLVGKFRKNLCKKWCGIAMGIGIFILYPEYCRMVEKMEHYVVFSIAVLIGISILYGIANKIISGNGFGLYLCRMLTCLQVYPVLFLLYALLSNFIGLPNVFCLAATSILMLITSVGKASGLLD